jgi:hypothetical protein
VRRVIRTVDIAGHVTCVDAETVELNLAVRKIFHHSHTTITQQSDFALLQTAYRSQLCVLGHPKRSKRLITRGEVRVREGRELWGKWVLGCGQRGGLRRRAVRHG